jgi:hypothetical protein
MASILEEQLEQIQTTGRHGLWLDHTAFTKKILLPNGASPYDTPASFMSYFIQANGLVKPDVTVMNVKDLYASWLALNPETRSEMAGKKRLSFALKKMLEAEAPKILLAEIILAILSYLNGRQPLFLSLPSPRQWLAWANIEANEMDPGASTESVEDAAMYLADFVRYFSELKITGLLLTERPDFQPESLEDVEMYRPLLNVAGHYRWSMGLQLPARAQLAATKDFNFVIAPAFSQSPPDLAGVDVSAAIWHAQPVPPLTPKQFYFTEIPENATPEHVLKTLSALREPG